MAPRVTTDQVSVERCNVRKRLTAGSGGKQSYHTKCSQVGVPQSMFVNIAYFHNEKQYVRRSHCLFAPGSIRSGLTPLVCISAACWHSSDSIDAPLARLLLDCIGLWGLRLRPLDLCFVRALLRKAPTDTAGGLGPTKVRSLRHRFHEMGQWVAKRYEI